VRDKPRCAAYGPVRATPEVEDLLRELAPQALGVIARRFGNFEAAEDAVQEALLAAARQVSRCGGPYHQPP
jgi:predicted RNA polymerase sigma factor